MPWTASDSDKHTKSADTPEKKAKWSKIANATRKKLMAEGKTESEASASAIKIANASLSESTVESIQEYASCAGQTLKVDREKCMIYGVKVLGRESVNTKTGGLVGQRCYTPAAITNGVKLYEGQAVFFDHQESGPRSYASRNGRLVNAREQADGIYADHHYNPKHPLSESYLWDAENCPSNVGFSHDADGRTEKKDGKVMITEIVKVRSVDLVAKPATVKSLFESEELPDDPAVREFAEHGLSAMSDCRSILLDSSLDGSQRRERLLEVIGEWRGELIEGELCDHMSDQENHQKLRKIHNAASDLISRCMYGEDGCKDVDAKTKHIGSVLADWSNEIKKLPAASSTTTNKESIQMEWKDITVSSLKEQRNDLVEQLTGTDAMSKLSNEVKAIKESLAAKDAELAAEKAKVTLLETEKANLALDAKIAEELKTAKVNTSDKAVCSDARIAMLREAKDENARKSIIELMVLAQKVAPKGSAPLSSIGESMFTPKSTADTLQALRS